MICEHENQHNQAAAWLAEATLLGRPVAETYFLAKQLLAAASRLARWLR